MTDKAKQISGTNLNLRLVTTPDKDELTELARNFQSNAESIGKFV
jgi:hypothetical protein